MGWDAFKRIYSYIHCSVYAFICVYFCRNNSETCVSSATVVHTLCFNKCRKYAKIVTGYQLEDPSNRERRMKKAWEWEGGRGGGCRTSINNGPTEKVEIWASLSLRRRLHLHVRKWVGYELAHTCTHKNTLGSTQAMSTILFIDSCFYFSQFSHTFRLLFLFFLTSSVLLFRIGSRAEAALASEAVGGLLDLKYKR